jgi:hypothetical protein
VVYVAREGIPGWTNRTRAWEAYHDREIGDGLLFMHDKLDILKEDDLAALSAILVHTKAVMLVLDPVSMTGGGKEDEENY